MVEGKLRILWLSRHSPTPSQKKKLENSLGKIEIIQVSTIVNSPYHVRQLMQDHQCEDIVAVLPLRIMGQLCSIGIYPIKPIETLKDNGTTEWDTFMRMTNVEVTMEPLKARKIGNVFLGKRET